MRLQLATVFAMALLQQSPTYAAEQTCGDIIGERPTSSAARVCATKELEAEEAKLKVVEKNIVTALSGETGLSLDKKSFQRAQRDWRQFRGSNCGLESALGPVEPTATQLACETGMTACRVKLLSTLLSVIADGGYFSANEPCR
jgi:uncharacterized protein YecT (DUF1311 family)